MEAQKLAQQVVNRYLSELDEFEPHSKNVQEHLRGPVQAVTLFILKGNEEEEKEASIPAPEEEEEEKKQPGKDWRDYLSQSDQKTPDLRKIDLEAYDTLSRRTKARLEAFLTGVALAVADANPPRAKEEESSPGKEQRPPTKLKEVVSIAQGLAFGKEKSEKEKASPVLTSLNRGSNTLLRTISSQTSSQLKHQQIGESSLVTRLELYIRSLSRVSTQGQECVIAAEPARAMKARARSIVVAFVDTVDTVHQQSPVLTRLLKALTKELLAVEYVSESICRLIRQIVTKYAESVSFASLAFLSSPEVSAEQQLTPVILKFLRYLQSNWKDCVFECELERMLALSIDSDLRKTFKTIEFHSIGHLLEICQGFRKELHQIELSPDMRAIEEKIDENEALRQALRDLQREVITINGNILPPVQSRKDLISLLSQALNSRTLTSAPIKVRKSRRKASMRRAESEPGLSGGVSDGDTTSGQDDSDSPEPVTIQSFRKTNNRRQRSFRLTTVDFLTKRLLLAASRTGTGGDAYFVVRDLFGGDDVEVVPSKHIHTHGRTVRPGSIEIIVKLASVTIKCHGSFDVYPKSLVGSCEPLIQVHTTTTETIALHEVRASDSSGEDGIVQDDADSEDSERPTMMVVQEKKTDRTGWRSLSIRPALYEQYEVFSTPS